MNVHAVTAPPPAELSQALHRFEEQFRYPLGPSQFFRIAHGDDYSRFFRAMGDGACFVAERNGAVLGVIGVALRRLLLPDSMKSQVAYFGDAKVDPAARGGRTLVRLVEAAQKWIASRTEAAFAVVMDGTAADPTRYTGRCGIPAFTKLGRIVVLRLPTTATPNRGDENRSTTVRGEESYLRLSAGRYACPGGDPVLRSQMEPLWLTEPRGRACGRLEDTRRAKRLIADDGAEMLSAHLSCFAYDDADAGVDLLRVACGIAADRGLPALFAAIAAPDAPLFTRRLAGMAVIFAPATIYGCGLETGPMWNINTAEI